MLWLLTDYEPCRTADLDGFHIVLDRLEQTFGLKQALTIQIMADFLD
jgi:hypothetical protein